MKFNIGKNLRGVKEYLTYERLVEISGNMPFYKEKFSNQQWAKIRKLIKKEVA